MSPCPVSKLASCAVAAAAIVAVSASGAAGGGRWGAGQARRSGGAAGAVAVRQPSRSRARQLRTGDRALWTVVQQRCARGSALGWLWCPSKARDRAEVRSGARRPLSSLQRRRPSRPCCGVADRGLRAPQHCDLIPATPSDTRSSIGTHSLWHPSHLQQHSLGHGLLGVPQAAGAAPDGRCAAAGSMRCSPRRPPLPACAAGSSERQRECGWGQRTMGLAP